MVNLSYTARGTGNHANIGLNELSSGNFLQLTGNVKSIFDLGRPDVAKLLDSDGNGKGEIRIGKSGWASTNENHVKARDYGLLPFNEVTKSDAAVNVAALNDAVRKHEGYAFYCARPEEVWIRFDIVELKEPPFDPSCHKIINAKGNPDWFEQSK